MSPEWKVVIGYFAYNLGLLTAAAIIGLGCLIVLYKRLQAIQTVNIFTLFLYSVTIGFTAIITLLFVLALSGLLIKNIIFAALTLAVLFALIYTKKNYALIQQKLIQQYTNKSENNLYKLSLVGITIIAALSVLTNVHVTSLYDGTSYHLPYAQFYLDHQGLATNINLRYPYQSHNGNLLYSFVLTFADSIYCQTLHGLFGVLTALIIFSLTLRAGISAPLAMMAAASFLSMPIFINASASADVDLFSCFFITMSIYTILEWQKDKSNLIALIISALSIAMAIGTKYISTVYLLLLIIYIVLNSYRSVRPLLIYFFITVLFGSWWYVRTYLLTGNPIHPFAPNIFGYSLWNETDIATQMHDLSTGMIEKNLTHFLMLPRLFNNESFAFTGLQYWLLGFYIAPLFWTRLSSYSKSLMLFTWPFLLLWFSSSQIWRYIIPMAPLVIIICFDLIQIALGYLYRIYQKIDQSALSLDALQPAAIGILILFVLQKTAISIVQLKHVNQWPITPYSQDIFLKKYSPEYQLISVANHFFEKDQNIFLFDFFQLNYFSKAHVVGEHFGPNRVRDVINLVITASEASPDNNPALQALMDRFSSLNIKGFIIDNRIPYNHQLFDKHFERLYSNATGAVYRIRTP